MEKLQTQKKKKNPILKSREKIQTGWVLAWAIINVDAPCLVPTGKISNPKKKKKSIPQEARKKTNRVATSMDPPVCGRTML